MASGGREAVAEDRQDAMRAKPGAGLVKHARTVHPIEGRAAAHQVYAVGFLDALFGRGDVDDNVLAEALELPCHPGIGFDCDHLGKPLAKWQRGEPRTGSEVHRAATIFRGHALEDALEKPRRIRGPIGAVGRRGGAKTCFKGRHGCGRRRTLFRLFEHGFLAHNNHHAAFGDVVAPAVGLEVVADLRVLGEIDVPVDDRVSDA